MVIQAQHPTHPINDPKNKQTILLHLPSSSFTTESNTSSSPLILLQLPPKFPIPSLSTSYFSGSTSKSCKTKPTTLVSESSSSSFTLSRVETSNSYILVPPASSPRPPDASSPLQITHAHLLGNPHGETSFLECRYYPLPRQKLLNILGNHKFGDSDGVSVDYLSRELQTSKKQVMDGLTDLRAMEVSEGRFVMLKEDISWDVRNAVVDAFVEMEWEARAEVAMEEIATEAGKRFAGDGKFDVRLAKYAMSYLGKHSDKIEENVTFDMNKVAIHFAHELLRKRSPYPKDDFLQMWHTRMPGADTTPPSVSLLAGIALVDGDSFSYYPAEYLSLDASTRFRQLFKKKERWALGEELDAYVKTLEKEGDVKELLLKFTRVVVDDAGRQWYTKK